MKYYIFVSGYYSTEIIIENGIVNLKKRLLELPCADVKGIVKGIGVDNNKFLYGEDECICCTNKLSECSCDKSDKFGLEE